MGNWRTVNLTGSLAAKDVTAAEEFLTPNDQWTNFGPLTYTQGLSSLGRWAREVISANGNLSERNYGPDDVAAFLRDMVKACPSLTMKVHCGADYEEAKCIATITVADGKVTVGPPEVEQVAPVDTDAAVGRLIRAISRDG